MYAAHQHACRPQRCRAAEFGVPAREVVTKVQRRSTVSLAPEQCRPAACRTERLNSTSSALIPVVRATSHEPPVAERSAVPAANRNAVGRQEQVGLAEQRKIVGAEIDQRSDAWAQSNRFGAGRTTMLRISRDPAPMTIAESAMLNVGQCAVLEGLRRSQLAQRFEGGSVNVQEIDDLAPGQRGRPGCRSRRRGSDVRPARVVGRSAVRRVRARNTAITYDRDQSAGPSIARFATDPAAIAERSRTGRRGCGNRTG